MFRILPDLHKSLVGIHNLKSIRFKIVATNCSVHNYSFILVKSTTKIKLELIKIPQNPQFRLKALLQSVIDL